MYISALAFLTVAATVSASNSTISLWLPGFLDSGRIMGCFVGSDATATTYALGCGSDECGLPSNGMTFTQGPSTLHYSYTLNLVDATETMDFGCAVTSAAPGSCVATMAIHMNSASVFSSVMTTTFSSVNDLNNMPVTITGCAAMSVATAASITGSGAGNPNRTEPTSSSNGTLTTPTATATATGSMVSAGGAITTGAPSFLIGGAAMVAVMAAM